MVRIEAAGAYSLTLKVLQSTLEAAGVPFVDGRDLGVGVAAAARRAPNCLDWGELVAGFRAGNIVWDPKRLEPPPGQLGCQASAAVLRKNGYGDRASHRRRDRSTPESRRQGRKP